MFAFELGRQYKLSIAEIFSLFPKMEIVYFDENILIIDKIDENKLSKITKIIGGTIKIIKIKNLPFIKETLKNEEIFEYIQSFFQENKKNNYAINIFGKQKINQKELLLKAKKYFRKNNYSQRFVNQDFKNIKSYQIKKEKLIKTNTDFNLIYTKKELFIGQTIFVQDINFYSQRDFGKQRDMQTGMLPPKLAQIMINISKNSQLSVINSIYDPFCGLGTILLEAILSGNKEIYGSDINPLMIEKTTKNIKYIKNNFKNNLENFEVIKSDAKNIENSKILENYQISTIITEGFLGEIFGPKNINLEKVKKVRNELKSIYEGFFSGLKKLNFKGNIVLSFPFWEIRGKYYYFDEIYEIIDRYCIIKDLLPTEIKTAKTGSLLYKRDNQTVGREIFKLKIKNKI